MVEETKMTFRGIPIVFDEALGSGEYRIYAVKPDLSTEEKRLCASLFDAATRGDRTAFDAAFDVAFPMPDYLDGKEIGNGGNA